VEWTEVAMRVLFVIGGAVGGMRIVDDIRAVRAHLHGQRELG
jgi:hypothetical protein